ncbi:MAG: hypothetical protein ABJE95_19600 [Byssovorax sp.]
MSERDDFAAALASVAKADPFAVVYRATVVVQHADGSVDLRLDGTSLQPRNVRLDVGIPGCRVIVDPGALVRLAFEGGTPDGAYAFGIPLDVGASRGLVAVGDLGTAGSFAAVGVALGAPIVFTYFPPGDLPSTGPPGTVVTLVTKATNGSAKVMIR